jgi:hypothetical protein
VALRGRLQCRVCVYVCAAYDRTFHLLRQAALVFETLPVQMDQQGFIEMIFGYFCVG